MDCLWESCMDETVLTLVIDEPCVKEFIDFGEDWFLVLLFNVDIGI